MSQDSTLRTLLVATAVCAVCSVFVSGAAVVLKPKQEANKLIEKKRNILNVVGLYEKGMDINAAFEQFEPRVVDMSTGEYVEGVDPLEYDQRKAAKTPGENVVLEKDEDIASIRSRAKLGVVYLLRNDDKSIKNVIVPVHGYGLWSTLYGFVALEGDANTVAGLTFYEHAETPGLGGEVDNASWKAQWPGKKVYNNEGTPVLELSKSGAAGNEHKVDALSGATLTSRGVTNLIQFWMSDKGWKPFLDKVKKG